MLLIKCVTFLREHRIEHGNLKPCINFTVCIVEINAFFYETLLFYMFCAPKLFLGTIELPDTSVLLDLLPHTPGKG